MMDDLLNMGLSKPPEGSRRIKQELFGQFRDAILSGRLVPDTRLPPTRSLAASLGIARNTVTAVYEMLTAEGYLVARIGGGTFVAKMVKRAEPASPGVRAAVDARIRPPFHGAEITDSEPLVRFDLSLGYPDKSAFPFDIWRRLTYRAVRQIERAPPMLVGPAGVATLRAAIAAHISFVRAIACEPDEPIVTSGAQQAFDLIARILIDPGRTLVAVEEPGYPALRDALRAAGAILAPVRVDESGIVVEEIPAEAKLICVTPSNHMPLGCSLSAERRVALLEHAARYNAVIIEDDYEGEFRFDGRPVDALKTLDRSDCVFYVNTFAKCLFPSVRLGYVIAPGWARDALLVAKRLTDWHSPAQTQLTLAAFIAEGHLTRHVRRMRRIYQDRRTHLIGALSAHFPDASLIGPGPGLHVAIEFPPSIDAERLREEAFARGVRVELLQRYYAEGMRAPNGLAMGLGLIASEHLDAAIEQLARAARAISH